MRLLSYTRPDGTASYGQLEDGSVVADAGDSLRADCPDLRSAIAAGRTGDIAASGGARVDLDQLVLLPPIPAPDKIICIGLNYQEHLEETGMQKPEKPSIFTRYPSSIVAHGADIVRPKASIMHDYEGELAVVIGTAGRHISESEAQAHILGCTCFNDGSVRDFQGHTTQFWPGKNFVASGAMGPWIVTLDELGDPEALTLETRLNGETVQSSPTSDLAFKIAELIAYISTVTELLPGDIIATGTPSGVGLYRKPRLFMKGGDTVEIEISGIGTLSNPVINEA